MVCIFFLFPKKAPSSIIIFTGIRIYPIFHVTSLTNGPLRISNPILHVYPFKETFL